MQVQDTQEANLHKKLHGEDNMIYEVSATFRGKRVRTNMRFTRKTDAQKYADATNKNYPGANARVVKGN